MFGSAIEFGIKLCNWSLNPSRYYTDIFDVSNCSKQSCFECTDAPTSSPFELTETPTGNPTGSPTGPCVKRCDSGG